MLRSYAQTLARFFLDGDSQGAWALIEQHAQAGHDSLFIYQELITGAMRYVGELWEHNEITVADEHLATSVCEFVLSRCHFANRPAVKNNKKAMFLCVEEELHDIGPRIVGCLFEELGWEVRCFGATFDLLPYCGTQTVLLGDLPHVHTWLTEQYGEQHSGVNSCV